MFMEIGVLLIGIAFLIIAISLFQLSKRVNEFLNGMDNSLNNTVKMLDRAVASIEPIGPASVETMEAIKGLMATVKEQVSYLDKRFNSLETTLNGLTREIELTLKTSRELEDTVKSRVEDLESVIKTASHILETVNKTVDELSSGIEKTYKLFDAATDAGRTIHSVTEVVRSGILTKAVEIASLASGVKASLEYVIKKTTKDRSNRSQ